MIRWLVDQGFTVFCISWRNPGPDLRDTTFDDYRVLGLQAALAVALAMTGAERLHLAGYCLGGTLSAIAAAAMARDGDDRIASLTLLAAQTDFSEAGGLSLFIDEQQLPPLEAMMAETGYLDGGQMAGAFALLADRDLIWSRAVRTYLLGESPANSDLMAWNRDTTRMPARMHAEYLRQMFLENRLATGHCLVDGRPVSVGDIHRPIFAVGTETDHVAPWRSVFKIHLLDDADVTFVLTAGGHNAGIVSEPGHPRRHYQIAERTAGAPYVDPEAWQASVPRREGSWWPEWAEWLAARSSAAIPAGTLGDAAPGPPPLSAAPGFYVLER
jgi:polyhydroxyalkanoate synthase